METILDWFAVCYSLVALAILGVKSKCYYSLLYLWADNGKMSGRRDGNVMMRNGRARGFRVPSLVRNIYTSAARTNLASFSSNWNGLSQADRDSWLLFSYTSSNRFGQPITITGKDAYVGLNTNLINAGQAPITTAPLVVAGVVGQFDNVLTASAGGDTLSWAFATSPVPGTNTVLMFATKPLRPGVKRPSQSAFRLIGTLAGGATTPQALATMYKAKYGTGAISGSLGARIMVQSIVVDNNTGEASAIAQADTIVAA